MVIVFRTDAGAEGDVKIRIDDGIGAVKFLGGYADDGHRMVVNFYVLTDNVAVASESFLPVREAEDENGVSAGSLSFGWEDEATECRLDTEDRKVIAGDASDDAVVAAIVGGESA